MRIAMRLAIGLGVLVGAAAAVTYSWTYTPLGRLDYAAAVMARTSTIASGPIEMTPESRRQANEMVAGMLSGHAPLEDVRFEDRTVLASAGHEIPVRIYWPESETALPFYLDIHGGGWWMGDGFPFHENMTPFAKASEAIVVSVDYRLAPEHPFPAGLDDCETVLRWIAREGDALGGDPSRIAIGGGSAGGNLSAALVLKMRDEAGPKIAFQYLFVPATDLSDTREWISYDETGGRYVLTVDGIREMTAAYVPDPAERMNPYVSPLLEGDLSGLPPALIVTALFDPLRDQGEAYARRLEAAGNLVELIREDGLHGLMGSPERGERINQLSAERVRAALHR